MDTLRFLTIDLFFLGPFDVQHIVPFVLSYLAKTVYMSKTVQVCSATREIRFFVNGTDGGVAYNNLPVGTPLYAAVSLYNKDARTVYNVRSRNTGCSCYYCCMLTHVHWC